MRSYLVTVVTGIIVATAGAVVFVPQQASAGSAVQTAYQAWRLYRCYRTDPIADGATFADSDTFDCGLRRALATRPDENVIVAFSATDPAYQTTASGGAIASALPGRIERWAQAVDQTDGYVYLCKQDPEFWSYLLRLVVGVARWVMEQLAPSGQAFYLPALTRDVYIDYSVTQAPAGARVTSVTFQPRVRGRQGPPEVPPSCERAVLGR